MRAYPKYVLENDGNVERSLTLLVFEFIRTEHLAQIQLAANFGMVYFQILNVILAGAFKWLDNVKHSHCMFLKYNFRNNVIIEG